MRRQRAACIDFRERERKRGNTAFVFGKARPLGLCGEPQRYWKWAQQFMTLHRNRRMCDRRC